MRLLYIGMESANWVINLCNKMCEQGHIVTCVVQGLDEYDKDNPIKPHENNKVIYVKYIELANPLLFQKNHLKNVIRENFDFIMGSHVVVSGTIKLIAETLKKPWGIMILDIPTNLMQDDRFRMLEWLNYFEICKYATLMVFNTHISRDEYAKYTGQYFSNDYVVTYATEMPEEYFKSGIDIQGDYVISVCRFCLDKNLKLIPRALSMLQDKIKYVAIGNDSDKKELEITKKICELTGVEFIHYPNVTEKEKFELIKGSKMLIYPQKTPFIGGLSPWEGMFVGKPVLVPKLKVMHDLYKENAIYFENDDFFSLAREIMTVNSLNPGITKKLREEAADFSKKEANFDFMAQKLVYLIELTIYNGKLRGKI